MQSDVDKEKEQYDTEVELTVVQDHSEVEEEMEYTINEGVPSSKGNNINLL